jgi:hypothetical protein
MSILKKFNLVAAPPRRRTQAENHRLNLARRLDWQIELAKDPNFVRREMHFTGKGEDRRQVERVSRVRRWWSQDASGHLVMSVFAGAKALELAPGKTGIAVEDQTELPELIGMLREAVLSGELDDAIEAAP